MTQSLVLALLGGAVLWISGFSTSYLNYVKPGFRPFLVGAGIVLVVLGVAGLFIRRKHDHAHGHGVAWLLCLPVFAILLVAPPALGSFAAARSQAPALPRQDPGSFAPLAGGGPVDMPVGEFIGRAWDDDRKSLTGRVVRLTGFVVPARRGEWYVTRMQIACCAADAFALKVLVRGLKAPPRDSWVEVTGTWVPHTFGRMPNGLVYPELAGTGLARVPAPAEPYE
ncbi:TIGR03943 family putative permease subunit [Streptosporangium saharense]|uniref:Putative repeat protein (TIGR03943 family) n=1 Tax=Streptosporangium saharense TaxID=1706840 RepID=A0A7W7QV23_9ACTN|nr:TIGR03943 family protein [Streptosporangium saharense]MBB4920301.1 putative repeat protein (TIGR03943 family) [Streptosporangium saharense]